MKNIKISVVMLFALLLSVGLFAQRGRGNNNHRYNRGNSQHYKPNHYYNYPRNRVTVQVGPGYNYRPVYRPYYRPAYRPVYRPVYRNPGAYVHYGPVFGVRINTLPYGYNRIYVGSNPYYYNDGVYYRPNNNNAGYEVVAPPLHAVVNRLPSNAIVTMIDGQKYYQVGGTFYQEEFDGNNRLSYRVAGTDGVINTQQEQYQAADETMNVDDERINPIDEVIPALGSRYDVLPAESKVQVINNQKYFVSPAGIYYKEVIEEDKIRYEVTTVQ